MGVLQYQTKKGRRYQAHLYLNGKKVATKAGFLTKRDAKVWMVDKENELLNQQDLLASTGFFSIAEKYLDFSQSTHKKNTYIYKKGAIKKFIQFLGQDFDRISKTQIRDFLLHYKNTISPKTANKYKVELVSLFNWAIQEDLYPDNPALYIKRFSETQYIPYIPPTEDLKAAIEAGNDFQKDFIRMLLHTAARQNEILNLTWEDVSFRNNTITLWTSKRRGGNKESRVLDMTQGIKDVLNKRKNESNPIFVFTNPLTGQQFTRHSSYVKNLFVDLCKEAGVKHFSAHSIRHYVASNLVGLKHTDTRVVQKILGHKNISTTEKYLQDLEVDRSATADLNVIGSL